MVELSAVNNSLKRSVMRNFVGIPQSLTPIIDSSFHLHTDKETGIAKWWAPFDLEWNFTYVVWVKKADINS